MTVDASTSNRLHWRSFLRPGPWKPVDWLLAGALVALTAIIVMWLIREPAFSDDLTYFEFAGQLLEGRRPRPNITNVYRFGFTLQVSAAQFLLGFSDSAYYLVSIGYSLGLVAVFFVLNRLLFGRAVAVGACLLLITNPIFLTEATILHIDLPAIFWFIAGLVTLFYGIQCRGRRFDRQSLMYLLVAGFSFFMSYWIKEGILILFPALPLVAFLFTSPPGRRVRALRSMSVVAVGFVAGLVVEVGVSIWLYGDPFIRLSTLMSGHVAGSREAWIASGLVSPDLSWLDLALRFPKSLMSSAYGIVLTVLIGLSLFLVGVARSRRLIAMGVLGVLGLLALSLLVSSLDPLVPLLRTKDRYLTAPLVPLFSVVAGGAYVGALMLTIRTSKRPFPKRFASGLVVIVIVLALSAVGITDEENRPYFAKNGARGMSETGALVEGLIDQSDGNQFRIFSDRRTLRGLRMYVPAAYRWNLEPLDTLWESPSFVVSSTDVFLPGDIVVLNRPRLELNARKYYVNELPDWVSGPPAHWVDAVTVPSQGIFSYYVARVEEIVDSPVLLSEFHAYSHSPSTGGGLTEGELVDDSYQIQFQRADDLRIVSGAGRYHLVPEDPAYPLMINSAGVLTAELFIEVDGDVTIRAVTAWLLGETAEPSSVELERQVVDEDKDQYVARIPVDPKRGHEYLRLMVQASGSGTVRITDPRVGRLATDAIPSVVDPLS